MQKKQNIPEKSINSLQILIFLRDHAKSLNISYAQEAIITRIVSRNGYNSEYAVNQKLLAEDLNMGERHVRRLVQPLIDMGIVMLVKNWKNNCYSISPNFTDLTGHFETQEEAITGHTEPVITGHTEPVTTDDTIYNNYNNIIINIPYSPLKNQIEDEEKEMKKNNVVEFKNFIKNTDPTSDKLRNRKTPIHEQVFEYYKSTLNHSKYKLDSKRIKVIQLALKTHTVDELKTAIDGVKCSDWHMGINPQGVVYDALSLIFRDAEKIDGFIQRSQQKQQERENYETYQQRNAPIRKISRGEESTLCGEQILREWDEPFDIQSLLPGLD